MKKEKSDLDIERVLYETLQNLEYLNETILRSHSIRFTNAEYDHFCSCMDATRCNLNDLENALQKKEGE